MADSLETKVTVQVSDSYRKAAADCTMDRRPFVLEGREPAGTLQAKDRRLEKGRAKRL
jgi:hypothetical protein